MTVFFGFMGMGLWGFVSLPLGWGIASLVAAFLAGGSLSMLVFERLASEEQRTAYLKARLFND
ncbi:hypothetical protein [Erythrobacter ani]|uniref:Uncharacterized protein n=1 Tax=Erythrobacter ani TaxID=2827235 RepID=A0ABS6SQJ4_9SPHN|nr:hypothetical protein [Erythrobacter ani]MBV7267310.1 hypothetical protein [Erythrobacter ani]